MNSAKLQSTGQHTKSVVFLYTNHGGYVEWYSHGGVQFGSSSEFKYSISMHACSVTSVVSDSLQPYGVYPARLLFQIIQAGILE